MARKSRRTPPADPVLPEKGRAVLYARLSVADNGVAGGDGLEVQVALLRRYAADRGWTVGEIYRDNGVSGAHFRRPGFCAMMEGLEKRGTAQLVVKDLSRLGRDWIETGRLLEEVFPALGVTVYAVDEGPMDQMLDRALRGISHDFYARDLGEKIRASIQARRQTGIFWGRKIPYGYCSSGETHGLRPEPKEAAEVRRMFARRVREGGEAVPPAVREILTDPIYAGYVPLRKYHPPAYRGARYRLIPRQERIYLPGQVPALVSRARFGAVWRSFYPDAPGPFPWEAS